jgi:hypothetical protein
MVPQCLLVGIIAIDADPYWHTREDATLGEALASLRIACGSDVGGEADPAPLWDPFDAAPESIRILTADIGQLTAELKNELWHVIEHLLATR